MPILSLSYSFSSFFNLIGIKTSLEDYRLAYLLNQALGIHLVKEKENQLLYASKIGKYFPLFKWEDTVLCYKWLCVGNMLEGCPLNDYTLFGVLPEQVFLEKSYKEVDFFLAVEGSSFDTQETIQKITQIADTSAFEIDFNTLSSTNQLIFQEC